MEKADALLAEFPVVDGHNDLAWALRQQVGYDLARRDLAVDQSAHLHTDIPRLRAGRVGAQFWSVYVSTCLVGDAAVTATLEQIDLVYRLAARYPSDLRLAFDADDVEAARRERRIACLMGAEGGHSINNSLATLRALHRLGVRYLTLTHNDNVDWADSATDEPRHGGLTRFGRGVVGEMNRLGMLVDLSHTALSTMRDALEVSSAPVIFSHSSARALCDHPRNIPDEILAQLPTNGGIAMATFVPKFILPEAIAWTEAADANMRAHGLDPLDTTEQAMRVQRAYEAANPGPVATVATVADHLDHMRQVAGLDHLGIGGDFDGTAFTPRRLEDVAGYPNLVTELLDRRWSPADVAKLTWHNPIRVLRDTESLARRQTDGPSIATLAEPDR